MGRYPSWLIYIARPSVAPSQRHQYVKVDCEAYASYKGSPFRVSCIMKQTTEFDVYDHSYDDEVNASISFSGMKIDTFTRIKATYIQDIISEEFDRAVGID